MKIALTTIFLSALCGLTPCHAADQRQEVFFLQLPSSDTKALGQIDRLEVTVTCSWISDLKKVPELYDIKMGYDIPAENVLDAEPRLGGAAVDLSQWSGVIGVHLPLDEDSKSCFKVKVVAEGRSGVQRQWNGQQLGLPK